MKTINLIYSLYIALLLAAGCTTTTQTPPQHDMTCDSALAAYAIYQSIIMHDGKPSGDQVIAARVAAEYLRLHCGYTFRQGKSAQDAHGVPRLLRVKP